MYRFDERDRTVLAWLCACGFFLLCGGLAGGLRWRYYPTVKGAEVTPLTVCLQLGYLALCLTPMLINVRADSLWRKRPPERKGDTNDV